MSTVSVRVDGLAELGQALQSFGPKLGTRYLKRATFAAAALIRAEAKARAPIGDTGALQESISVFKRPSGELMAEYDVGIRQVKLSHALNRFNRRLKRDGLPYFRDTVYYARFVEYGFIHSGGKFIPARPFMRPAFDNKAEAAVEVFRVILADGVEALAAGGAA